MEKNICIIGLAKNFTDQMCRKLSTRLGMFYANADEFVDYNLEAEEMKKICGLGYFKNKQVNEIKKVCKFENTLIYINYELLNESVIYDIVKSNCVILYFELKLDRLKVELQKENLTDSEIDKNITMYNDRDFLCETKAHIKIPFDNKSDDEIIEIIALAIEN